MGSHVATSESSGPTGDGVFLRFFPKYFGQMVRLDHWTKNRPTGDDALRGWLDSPEPDDYQLPAALYDDDFQRLIQQQNNIGWKQSVFGTV